MIHGDCKINNLLFHPHENDRVGHHRSRHAHVRRPRVGFRRSGALCIRRQRRSRGCAGILARPLRAPVPRLRCGLRDRRRGALRGSACVHELHAGPCASSPTTCAAMLLQGRAAWRQPCCAPRSQLDLAQRFHAASAALAQHDRHSSARSINNAGCLAVALRSCGVLLLPEPVEPSCRFSAALRSCGCFRTCSRRNRHRVRAIPQTPALSRLHRVRLPYVADERRRRLHRGRWHPKSRICRAAQTPSLRPRPCDQPSESPPSGPGVPIRLRQDGWPRRGSRHRRCGR